MTFKRYFIMLDSKFIGNAFFCEVIYSTVGLMARDKDFKSFMRRLDDRTIFV